MIALRRNQSAQPRVTSSLAPTTSSLAPSISRQEHASPSLARLTARQGRTAAAVSCLGARLVVVVVLLALAFNLVGCTRQRGTVGAKFGRDADGHLFVREAPAGLGAASAGVKVGDEVILIDGRDVRPLSEEGLHAILSGERGTVVRFTVLRDDEVQRLAVERTLPPQNSRNPKVAE